MWHKGIAFHHLSAINCATVFCFLYLLRCVSCERFVTFDFAVLDKIAMLLAPF